MPPGFWVSCVLLTFLRLARSCTLLGATVSVLLSFLVVWLQTVHCRWIHHDCGLDSLDFYRWLGAATWVTTLAGMSRRDLAIGFFLLVLLWSASLSGWIGLVTGLMINLPLPPLKCRPAKETYGIYRVRGC